MTSASLKGAVIQLNLSRSEALVLFEWLSRNWERTRWEDSEFFADPAEKQIMISIENDLARLLDEPFDPRYREIVHNSYRALAPEPEEGG